jgi:hypothetical protein
MPRRLIIFVTAAVLAFAALPASAEPQFPPGLRIGLEPQGDLTLSKRLPGFEDADRKVAVAILDLPARAYEDIERSAFGPQQSGLTDLKRESFPFASGIGFLITGAAEENGVKLRKWFLLATAVAGPVTDLAVLINVQVPEGALSVYTDALVRKMLATATFRPAPIQEQLAMLPFKINEMSGFRVLQVLPQGGVVLIDGPGNNMSTTNYVVVSVGSGAPETPDERGNFARELLSTAPLRGMNVTRAEPMRIGGLQGNEIRGQAQGLNGEPVNVVQWVRFGSGGFLRVVGVGPPGDWDAVFTRLRAIRDGVTAH